MTPAVHAVTEAMHLLEPVRRKLGDADSHLHDPRGPAGQDGRMALSHMLRASDLVGELLCELRRARALAMAAEAEEEAAGGLTRSTE